MTLDQQRLADYLTHIQVAIERIHRYASPLTEIDPPYAQESDPPVATERRAVLTV